MKKFPYLRQWLAFVLALQMTVMPALATETEQAEQSAQVSADAQAGEGGEAAPEETTEPETTEPVVYAIPENVSGDASINHGCSTINASSPLIDGTQLEVEAGAALMYEINSGTLLYNFNGDEKMYPASVTKIMTCLVALDQGNVDDIVTVSTSVVANRDPSGSNCSLVAGEQMSLEELLYCLMVASANDAGSAISEHIAGSEAAFVALMNEKAAQLGCTNTHFANPHGLHDENHYTTARDLAKIMLAALEYDLFREIYSTRTHTVPATNMSQSRYLLSTNYMIEKSIVEHYYDERVIGGKTGFTTPAGRCLAAVSESGDMQLLTIVLGGESNTNEYGTVIYGSFETTGNLIDYGFNNFTLTQILSSDAILKDIPVTGGENNTQAYVKESVSTLVPVDLNRTQLQYEYTLNEGTLTAPVAAEQPLGYVRVWYQSKCVAQEKIYAAVASEIKQTGTVLNGATDAAAQDEQGIGQAVWVVLLILLVIIVIFWVRGRIARSRRKKRRQTRRSPKRSNQTWTGRGR